jgi:hypothetical protein
MKFYIVRYKPDYKHLGGIKGPLITLREPNKAVLAAEVEHVKQWYAVTIPAAVALAFISLWIVPLAFLVAWPIVYNVRAVRRWVEVAAFKKYIAASDDKAKALDGAARKLSTAYKLNITYREALELLQ